MEFEDVKCWGLVEAIGDRGPHRLRHLLWRAVWDDKAVPERTAAWAVHLPFASSAGHCLIGRHLYVAQ